MRINKTEDKKRIIDEFGDFHKFLCYEKTSGRSFRALKEVVGDWQNIFVFAPRSKTQGKRYPVSMFVDYFDIEFETNFEKEEKWHKRLKKAVSAMESSGLWSSVKNVFEVLLTMTWEDHEKLKDLYMENLPCKINKDKEGLAKMEQKYPSVFNEEHNIISDYIDELSDCRLKSMYFGKFANKEIKNEISCAMNEKRPYSTGRIRANYDVSFVYKPEGKKAWYSEEYKNCGNGYYYIALNATTALFIEKD